jgi:hypothetical protein
MTHKTSRKGMRRAENFIKRSSLSAARKAIQRLLERGFDWIVLVVVTLIILFTLLYF